MAAERLPVAAFAAACRADIGRVGGSRERAVEPFASGARFRMLAVLEPGHQETQSARRYFRLVRRDRQPEMAPGLAPELRRQRRFRERDVALDLIGVLRRQTFEPGNDLQRRHRAAELAPHEGQLGMGDAMPRALDRPLRRTAAILAE
jgi:hypothetical protein